MKQTAVEWLIEKLLQFAEEDVLTFVELIEQFKKK